MTKRDDVINLLHVEEGETERDWAMGVDENQTRYATGSTDRECLYR